ncbi:tol-Pal system protein TolA-like [Sardina pilchardus]|uniref:tol-Pal system protein TolA-like n=1 Tax=Sardina pilchardus TaxID=27697 RepID=UPI002E1307F9
MADHVDIHLQYQREDNWYRMRMRAQEERELQRKMEVERQKELQRKMEVQRQKEVKRQQKAARLLEMKREREKEMEEELQILKRAVLQEWAKTTNQQTWRLTQEEIEELQRRREEEQAGRIYSRDSNFMLEEREEVMAKADRTAQLEKEREMEIH